ncbi:MAG: 50S ribosomal protein L21 [Patescibacteria group bacterium]
MKRAVIVTGGKQYLVAEGDTISIEKLAGGKDGKVSFDTVLLVDDETKLTLGTPEIAKVSVSATIVEEGKAKKILVVKYKAKSRYYKKRGHRQPFTKVKIEKIS